MGDNNSRQPTRGGIFSPASVLFVLTVLWAGGAVWTLMTPTPKTIVNKLDTIQNVPTRTRPEHQAHTAKPNNFGKPLNQGLNLIASIEALARPIIPAAPKLAIKRRKIHFAAPLIASQTKNAL